MTFSPSQVANILDTLVVNASRALHPSKYDTAKPQMEDRDKIGDFESTSTPELQSCNSSLKSNASEKDVKSVISTVPLELPFVPSTPALYKPSPYTFRIPSNILPIANGSNLAKCPPYHIQLDHALAVIWSLFSNFETKKPLGVAQIQWALSFLRGIQDQHGQNPKDVAVCIDTMEEALIQKYAEMANTVKSPGNKIAFKKPEIAKIPEILPTDTTSKTSTAGSNQNKLDSRIVVQKMPFSVNYADMARRKPISERLEVKKEIVSTESSQKSEQSDDTASSSAAPSLNMSDGFSRDTIINFLKAWRKEQISKIQEELKRLHLIEEFISNVDLENFTPYLDTTQLDVLVTQKLKKYKVDNLKPSSSRHSVNKPQAKTKGSHSVLL